MSLYAVTIGGVYPLQCVVVWDRKESAVALSEHLNNTVKNVTYVQSVDSFFPLHMVNADPIWIDAAEKYLRGDHINTSGESE